MRIYRENDSRPAAWRKSNDGKDEGYFVTPVGTNRKSEARWLPSIEDLGYFLLKNPTWKVYFGDNQQKSGVVVEGKISLGKLI
jgi:hypothetical protein